MRTTFLYGAQSSARVVSHHAPPSNSPVVGSLSYQVFAVSSACATARFFSPEARKTPRHSARINPCQPSDEKATTSVVSAETALPLSDRGAKSGARPSEACQTRPSGAAARGPAAATKLRVPSGDSGKPSGRSTVGARACASAEASASAARASSLSVGASVKPSESRGAASASRRASSVASLATTASSASSASSVAARGSNAYRPDAATAAAASGSPRANARTASSQGLASKNRVERAASPPSSAKTRSHALSTGAAPGTAQITSRHASTTHDESFAVRSSVSRAWRRRD